MKIQRANHTCGILAVVNALRALGKRVTEREVRKHTGTTKKDGTTQFGLMNALERLGQSPQEFRATKSEAFDIIHGRVADGDPVILSVEEGRHWVTAVGVIGERVIVYDSWRAAWNVAESGVWVLDEKKLMRWWVAEEDTGSYYGIIVGQST